MTVAVALTSGRMTVVRAMTNGRMTVVRAITNGRTMVAGARTSGQTTVAAILVVSRTKAGTREPTREGSTATASPPLPTGAGMTAVGGEVVGDVVPPEAMENAPLENLLPPHSTAAGASRTRGLRAIRSATPKGVALAAGKVHGVGVDVGVGLVRPRGRRSARPEVFRARLFKEVGRGFANGPVQKLDLYGHGGHRRHLNPQMNL